MESFNTHAGRRKPQSYTSAPLDPSSPQRVRTDPQSISKKSHLPSLHHHPHRNHHHHSRHGRSTVQSTIQLHAPTSFGDILKQASRSKDNSPSPSRRESVIATTPERNEDVYTRSSPRQKPIGPDDVVRERARVKLREDELRTALHSSAEQSIKTSRRLDDKYYIILEKISSLRQTIGNLQELCGMSKELHETFQSETRELSDETKGQLEGFNDFKTQQQQVTALGERIRAGKEKADALTARLAEARQKVKARAKLDTEWEAATARRLRILWGILGSISGLILLAILFQQLKPMHNIPKNLEHVPDFGSREGFLNAPIPDAAKEAARAALMKSSTITRNSAPGTPTPRCTTELEDGHRLLIFDEL